MVIPRPKLAAMTPEIGQLRPLASSAGIGVMAAILGRGMTML